MKKILPIVILVVILVGGFFLFFRGRKTPEGPLQPTPTPLPLSQRPYITLTPTRDGHNFKLRIENIKDVQKIEYELVYLTSGLSRGVIGSVEVEGKDVLTKEILLGSCSKNVCKYDEDITSGTLTLRFRGASSTQKYVLPFNLYEGTGSNQTFSLEEANFSFEGKLTKGGLYLVCQTVGLPGKIEGEVLAGPYGVFTEEKTLVSGTIQIGSEGEFKSFQVLAWNLTSVSWAELSSGLETDGRLVKVETESLTTFVITSE